ncbi:hypothetical protein V3C99_004592, partial [Haemonchus contortus]
YFLCCCAIVFYLSLAEEGKKEKPLYCYLFGLGWSAADIAELGNPHLYCSVSYSIHMRNGTLFDWPEPSFLFGVQESPKSENPLGCELLKENKYIWYPKDGKEFLQYEGDLMASCYCNQSPICATQPETFKSILKTKRSNSPFYAIKAAELVVEFLSAGLVPNNTAEVLEEFMATLSTSATEATTTEASTTTETTVAKETSITATFTISTETSTTAAMTPDYEYWDASTLSAYADSSSVTDTTLFTTIETEVAELQQMDSFLGQYGLVFAASFGFLLILVIVIIAYMMRKEKENGALEGAVAKRGTRESEESEGTSNGGSKESQRQESSLGCGKDNKD